MGADVVHLEGKHDGKDIGDVRERLQQRADDELHAWVARDQAQRAEHPQDLEGAE